MKVSALPGKPLWGGLSSSTPLPRAPYRHPSRRCGVRRASCSGSPRPRESTLIERQTSLNINGLGVMFIAVTRGGAGLPPAFGKEAWEGRAGCAPTVPASGESWAPWSCGWPCPSWEGVGTPSLAFQTSGQPCFTPRCGGEPEAGGRGMGSGTGCDCILLERSSWHTPSPQPGTAGPPRLVGASQPAAEPSGGPCSTPARPRLCCIPAWQWVPGCCTLRGCAGPGQRGQLPGGLFNPVCSNLAIRERESRAQAD